MAGSETNPRADSDQPMSRDWHWHPQLPIPTSPLFSWPPRPMAVLKWWSGYWLTISAVTIELLLTVIVFLWLQPSAVEMQTLSFGWIGAIYLRNLLLITLIAGGLHLYFHTLNKQGQRGKYEKRGFTRNNRKFTFRDQVRDNMFWTLASGVTFWTLYEVLYFWAWSNGWLPTVSFSENPVWFVALFLLIPIWSSMHFYVVHRLLHYPRLFKLAHALHHRNVNVGPWTGISMHPVEHAFYFSSVLIHFIIASHPLHLLFHLYLESLNPAFTHSGFDGVEVGGKKRLQTGDFFHQLHHRYFECNFGTAEMPWDKWFGSFHDGSAKKQAEVLERQRAMAVAMRARG